MRGGLMARQLRFGWIGTHIESARIIPEEVEYSPGVDVVFEGRLVIHGWPDWFGGGDQPIILYSDGWEVATTKSGPDGRFSIPFMLPTRPGSYAYRAQYSGSGWPAGWDPCTSDTVVVKVAGVPPPPCETCATKEECEAAGCYWYGGRCHSRPSSPPIPPTAKYVLAAVGVIAVVSAGLLLARRKKA